ncbi:type II toxin-antitoxin system death-on-curing family toxin [Vreelandella titanicae]|uniref:Death-on-curing protein n=1 Tax=Vreelandella titanicae BH1 TaxID=1204738 RepID=L9UBQ3_9GAMM|nr:type II toxin-antitoxin system death-on-curing family toxin [Halomonas titanicae]ELY22309.1 Death-on-curing protein [Halomonas titanicae BH1]
MSDCGSDNDGIRYIVVPELVQINKEMLRLTPGEPFGIRDQGGLESAQQKPCMHRYYTQTEDLATLASVLGMGLVQNHPFLNANKRTAADAVYRFLLLNGYELTMPDRDIILLWEGAATHAYNEEDIASLLAYWLREFDSSSLND